MVIPLALSEMIIEDILAQESYLSVNKETEVAALLTYSSMRLENVTPIIKGDAILTDGKKHYFEVKQRVLNERLMYNSSDAIIYAAINDLISKITYYQNNEYELEKIAYNGYLFIKDKFQKDHVAKEFFNKINEKINKQIIND